MKNFYNTGYILTAKQAKEIDNISVKLGKTTISLMEAAAQSVFNEIIINFPRIKSVLVLCGPGNNGADGFLLASMLDKAKINVTLASTQSVKSYKDDSLIAASRYNKAVLKVDSNLPIRNVDLIVDALFGIGLDRNIPDDMQNIFAEINILGLPVLAIDIPSGIKADDGTIMGSALKAQITVTFGFKKPGHVLLPGKEYCGKTVIYDIGFESGLAKTLGANIYENMASQWLKYFPRPNLNDHKYSRGYAVIVAGEHPGAAKLAAKAAMRVGAGIVKIIAPTAVYSILASSLDEIIVLDGGEKLDRCMDLLSDDRISSILIGSGLGKYADLRLIEQIIALGKPLVLDAEAITVFADNPDKLKNNQGNIIITPHYGEFNKVFGNLDRYKIEKSQEIAAIYNLVCVLKGNDTVISNDKKTIVSSNAPPQLATAGSGDVLAGFLVGFLSQIAKKHEIGTSTLLYTSAMACWFHAEAANRIGHNLIAGELQYAIPALMEGFYTKFSF